MYWWGWALRPPFDPLCSWACYGPDEPAQGRKHTCSKQQLSLSIIWFASGLLIAGLHLADVRTRR